jgi:hypothetical protein
MRIIILPPDGRGARNAELGPRKLALAITVALAFLAITLWLGWKLGELI